MIRKLLTCLAFAAAIPAVQFAATGAVSAASCAAIYHPGTKDTVSGCVGLTFGYKQQAVQVCRPVLAWKPDRTMYGNLAGNQPQQSITFSCDGTVVSYGYRIVWVGI